MPFGAGVDVVGAAAALYVYCEAEEEDDGGIDIA